MTAGLTRLLRLLAVAGMVMAFGQFLLVTAHWVQFDRSGIGPWVGKRVKDRFMPPVSTANTIPPNEMANKCQIALRQELTTWLHTVQPSGQWLALCGVLYLLAGRSRDMAAVRADDE